MINFFFAVSVSIFRFPSLCGERERDLEREREMMGSASSLAEEEEAERGAR
jgi:hypothetical protein